MMNDTITNNSTNGILSRYCFILQQNIEPLPQDEFGKKISAIEIKTTEVEEIVREVASKVYSYAAMKEETKETYRQWDTELQSPIKIIISCDIETTSLYKMIPFLPTQAALENMKLLNRLGLRLGSISNKIENLKTLLESPVYANAVILYKNTISLCENICDQKNPTPHLSKLSEEITNKKQEHYRIINNLNQSYLINQIKLIHEGIQLCYEATKKLCEQKGQPGGQSIEDTICQKLNSLKLDNEEAEKRFSVLRKIIEQRREKAQLVTLRKDLALSSGWFETTITKWGNSDLEPFIAEMEQLAKKLQVFEEEVQECLQKLYEKSSEGAVFFIENEELFKAHFETPLSLLSKSLERICTHLYDLLYTKQARAGLYYAARLSACIQDIYFSLSQMFTDISPENSKTIGSIGHTLHFLVIPENSMNPSQKITALFQACCSVSKALLTCTKNDRNYNIINCLETLIACEGTKTIQAHDTDNKWFFITKQTHNRQYINDLAFTSIIQYIISEITEWFYFSKQGLHIKLDMIIYLTKSNNLYKDRIKEKCENEQSFSQIYNSYKIQFNEEILSHLVSLFELIARYKKHLRDYDLDEASKYYSQAIVKIYVISQAPCQESEQSHIIAIMKLAINDLELQENNSHDYGRPTGPTKEIIENFAKGVIKDDSYTTIMLHLLSKALWLNGQEQEKEKEEATNLLCAHFKTLRTDFFSFTGQPINCLVAEFVIKRAIDNQELCEYEKLVIRSTLKAFSESENSSGLYFPKHTCKEDLKKLRHRKF